MRPAGSPAKAKQTGGLRVTRVACLRHDALEGLQMRIQTVEAFDRWYQNWTDRLIDPNCALSRCVVNSRVRAA